MVAATLLVISSTSGWRACRSDRWRRSPRRCPSACCGPTPPCEPLPPRCADPRRGSPARRGAGPLCIAECPHDEGNEEAGISHHDIRLDALQVLDPELPAARQRRCQQLLDASGADTQVEVVARTDIANAATGSQHVERVVVAAVAGRIVVGIDDQSAPRIDELWHLTEGQDGEGSARLGRVRAGSHSLPPWPSRMRNGGSPTGAPFSRSSRSGISPAAK